VRSNSDRGMRSDENVNSERGRLAPATSLSLFIVFTALGLVGVLVLVITAFFKGGVKFDEDTPRVITDVVTIPSPARLGECRIQWKANFGSEPLDDTLMILKSDSADVLEQPRCTSPGNYEARVAFRSAGKCEVACHMWLHAPPPDVETLVFDVREN
jgi:hypothetical protein